MGIMAARASMGPLITHSNSFPYYVVGDTRTEYTIFDACVADAKWQDL